MSKNAPLVLMILDGWGFNENAKYNAIAQAHTPQWDAWWQTCPHILLNASGLPVGLPVGQMGNSEVGHMHIGSGRRIQQDFTRINEAIEAGEFAANPAFNEVVSTLKESHNSLHIMGLLSPGGVHSHEDHLFALLSFLANHNFNAVHLHLFLDGRDTPPQSAIASIRKLEQVLQTNPVATISSICGRYYAMDRDKRWERLEPVYDMLTQAECAHHFNDAETAINGFYKENISDEFIPPCLIGEASPIKNGDAILFFNFRADRARQLTAAFVDPLFNGFQRKVQPKLSQFVTLTEYDENLPTTKAYPPIPLNNTFGEVIAAHNLSQLRIAETEKYAHVTFFFNGGSEKIFINEERILIPSPKIATYDLQPEMSAPELTDALVVAIKQRQFDVIICNYANADMVGHSGNFAATVKAIECLDQCMQRVGKALAEENGSMLITADHGNAEEMFDETTHQPHTAHTVEPVPLVFVGRGWHFAKQEGSLMDIAPTLLSILNLEIPQEMTGTVLMEKNNA